MGCWFKFTFTNSITGFCANEFDRNGSDKIAGIIPLKNIHTFNFLFYIQEINRSSFEMEGKENLFFRHGTIRYKCEHTD